MADQVSKLATVISDLETQTQNIQGFTNILSKIEELKDNVSKLSEEVSLDATSYKKTIDDFQQTVRTINTLISALESSQDQLYAKISTELKSQLSTVESLIESKISSMHDTVIELKSQISSSETKMINEFNKIMSDTQKEQRLANYMCLECGKPVGLIRKITGKQYCSTHKNLEK